ncbi:malonate--CoA ligase [Falsihalocynthiibacter arcticus]|uniref:Malonyl-CoA synthase n=1 Tax=Falsihalocynthiibacter arcticus TaxID=1579316 RepID=A0A126V263_9RHOB|nr:malonyl-CoA synthase [Falsihalocynthiibacter arcticus]AML51769.1 malonyl-CoA synthase [Falsihalocynthiibacter arcticus]
MYNSNHLACRLRVSSLDKTDLVFAKRSGAADVTYQDLWQLAEKYAAVLVGLGLTSGDRVAVQVEKSVEMIGLYLGTILAGGVFLPLNSDYTPTEIEYFVADSEPVLFVCTPDAFDVLYEVATKKGVQSVLSLGADGTGTLVEKALAQEAGFEAVKRGTDDLAAILYTSGTTGRSKGAMLTHGNLASNAATLCAYWRFSSDDVLIHALPIFHTHGLFVCTNVMLMAGASSFFLTRFDPEQVIGLMEQATVLMGVPTFYTRLLKQPDLSPETVKSMRLFVSGSAPLLAETNELWLEKTGHTILERYGMTETNMNTSNPYEGIRKAGTVGLALPAVDVRVTDPSSGEPLGQGEVGSIEVKGPNVFQGYWRMPEKTREELRPNGYFITGDIGMIDEDGYVSIVGRSKDLVITGGYNVYPKEIETLLDAITGIRESAVVGLPHADFGEGVAAVIVTEGGAVLSEQDVLAAIASKVARYKQPKILFFVDDLPRNTMGKVQKNILRKRFQTAFHP